MTSVVDRRVVVTLAAISVFVFALVLVARSQAGSQKASFSTFVAPGHVTAGVSGLAGAKYIPSGDNNGSATHVTITLTFPAGTANIRVTACPGSSFVSGNVATCLPGTVHDGQLVKMFATYTAGQTAGTASVNGQVTWDVPTGGGSTGGHNSLTSSPPLTIDSAGGSFAGECSPPDSIDASDSKTGKGASLAFGTVDASLGFPCTPAQVGIENQTRTFTGASTRGDWSLLVAPLANGESASATLTIAKLASGVTWDTARLLELDLNNNTTPVPDCLSGGGIPGGADICRTGQIQFGDKGVEFFVNFLGTGVDPRVSS